MRRSGRKGADDRFSGVCLSGDGQKRNDSGLFSRIIRGAQKSERIKSGWLSRVRGTGTRMKRDDQRHPVLTLF